ncbi:hypothetical protein K0817_012265 [Microbacterium sp. HD4P20]|uniref:hypothetical protein n=1 Tax=Microbacterium sp. HD4P20 TaxID=2864874 RepID=UPI001C63EBD8|nr:hypothetical protein [Microbacterium sp. HD4P20]MCP2637331.1 hypothetical protein [Microbacterium sp. HD4P20]
MKLSAKATVAGSALVVGGLVALAVPAVASVHSELSSWAVFSPEPEPTAYVGLTPASDREPTAEPIKDRTHGDCELLYYPDGGISPALEAPIDTGVREFAAGTVELVDGIPTLYTVAAGDAMAGIGTRFCTFSPGIFYFNDVHLQGTIQPGDVLRLR